MYWIYSVFSGSMMFHEKFRSVRNGYGSKAMDDKLFSEDRGAHTEGYSIYGRDFWVVAHHQRKFQNIPFHSILSFGFFSPDFFLYFLKECFGCFWIFWNVLACFGIFCFFFGVFCLSFECFGMFRLRQTQMVETAVEDFNCFWIFLKSDCDLNNV